MSRQPHTDGCMSQAHVAAALGISRNAVAKLERSALAKLRRRLGPRLELIVSRETEEARHA